MEGQELRMGPGLGQRVAPNITYNQLQRITRAESAIGPHDETAAAIVKTAAETVAGDELPIHAQAEGDGIGNPRPVPVAQPEIYPIQQGNRQQKFIPGTAPVLSGSRHDPVQLKRGILLPGKGGEIYNPGDIFREEHCPQADARRPDQA